MDELIRKAAQKASQEEVFSAIAYAALKARAGRIAPNQIIKTGSYELLVADDENGEGLVVQIILSSASVKAKALQKAGELDSAIRSWNDHDIRIWFERFLPELSAYLEKWQGIKMRRGPGENITFEKAVSR